MKLVFRGNICRFSGTPLQIYLMLEVSVGHFKNWIENSEEKCPIFNNIGKNVLEVYEKIIKKIK